MGKRLEQKPAGAPLPAQEGAVKGKVWLFAVVIIAMVWVVFAWSLWQTVREREAVLRTQDAQLANALQMQVGQLLQGVELVMAPLVARLAATPVSEASIQSLLQTQGRQMPAFLSLLFIDAHGRGVAASAASYPAGELYTDRDYFRAHLDPAGDALHIGGPLVGRAYGRQFFTVSRRVTAADGRFVGVLVAMLEPEQVARLFDEFPLGNDAVIALVHRDARKVIAHSPRHRAPLAEDVLAGLTAGGWPDTPAGSYLLHDREQVVRLMAFHRVGATPLLVLVGHAQPSLAGALASGAAPGMIAGALLSLLVVMMAWQLVRGYQRTLALVAVEHRLDEALFREAEGLRESSRRLNEAQRLARVGSWELDLVSGRLTWSDEIFRLFEIDPSRFAASYEAFLNAIHPDDRQAVDAAYTRSLETREPYEIDHRLRMPDGRIKHVRERCETDFDEAGQPLRSVGTVQDVTAEVLAEARIRLYAKLFEHSGEAIMITDRENHVLEVNAAFTRLTGYDIEEIRGCNPRFLASGRTPQETYQRMWSSLQTAGHWQGELWDRHRNGAIYPKWASISAICDDYRQVTHYVASFTDISERKAAEERISYLAHHDVLTGLPNRFSLESRLEQALLTARREQIQLAVMFIDLDRFKIINDTLGHHVGDLLLGEVANRLRLCVRESDIVARLGGDEFVVVLTGLVAAADAASVANKVLHLLAEPYDIEGHALHSSPSIGISIFPSDGESAENLMKAADTAMYHAKEQGRNNAQYFTPAMNAEVHERMQLEAELRVALREGQLELHYQPKISVSSERVCGVEALARWQHPVHGLIPPMKFIPVAEESGLIEELGYWVLDEACRQWAVWRASGIEGIQMAINLSAQQLRSRGLVETVAAAMRQHGLGPGDLELEITESVAMSDPQHAIQRLRELRDLGVHLAIDDFGTGYSSLAYLKLLPIQVLKLDRSFVKDIETDENDAAISAAAIALAHNLGLEVVAEGVETGQQADFLREHGCDFLQGFRYGRPEPASHLSDILQAGLVRPLS